MRAQLGLLVAVALAAPLGAQGKAPLRDAEGRFVFLAAVERGIRLPGVIRGDSVAGSVGPRVLLVRTKDGKLELVRIRAGKKGPAPKPPQIEEGEEIVEEVEVETHNRRDRAKPRPKKKAKKPARAKLGGKKPAAAKPAAKPSAKPELSTKLPSLTLSRRGGQLTIQAAGEKPLQGKVIDRVALAKLFERLRAKTAASVTRNGRTWSPREKLELAPRGALSIEDFLQTWGIARSLGFRSLSIRPDPKHARARLSARDARLLHAVPETYGWKRQRPHIWDGEVLVAVDRKTLWSDALPIYLECARVGIWRVAFVAAGKDKQVWKIPTYLPVDM